LLYLVYSIGRAGEGSDSNYNAMIQDDW